MAMRLSLLFPDRKVELNLNDEAFEGMKGRLEELRGRDWWNFSYLSMNLSLLFPERKAQLDLNEAAFEGMKGQLEESRGTSWWSFSDIAMNLSVLASQRAQLTHDGRILITPKPPKLTPEPKPLPIRPTF